MFLRVFKTGVRVGGRERTAPGSDDVRSHSLCGICKSSSCCSSCEDVVNRVAGLFVGLGVDLYVDLMGIWGFHPPERLESTFYRDSCNKLIKQISVIVSMKVLQWFSGLYLLFAVRKLHAKGLQGWRVVTITISATRVRAYRGRCVKCVRHWYSVVYVRESNGQVSVHLDCN